MLLYSILRSRSASDCLPSHHHHHHHPYRIPSTISKRSLAPFACLHLFACSFSVLCIFPHNYLFTFLSLSCYCFQISSWMCVFFLLLFSFTTKNLTNLNERRKQERTRTMKENGDIFIFSRLLCVSMCVCVWHM